MITRIMCVVSAVIFALVAIMHLWRYIAGVEVLVGGTALPMWPSIGGAIFASILAIGNALGASKCKCN